MSKALTHNHWYHGVMPRDEIENLLEKDGDFIVRKTEVLTHVSDDTRANSTPLDRFGAYRRDMRSQSCLQSEFGTFCSASNTNYGR